MSRIFISGSTTGLGLMAAKLLVKQGHDVVLHARNSRRAEEVRDEFPHASAIVTGDLETISGSVSVAEQVNALGKFDTVIHNAGVGYREPHRLTKDGLPHVFSINTLAPYILTSLINRPERLIYLSSGMHRHAKANLDDILWTRRYWNGAEAYSESKLHDVMLAFAVACRWPEVISTSLEPGWVPTQMGGPEAPDDIDQAHLTQCWLAVSDDPKAKMSAKYYYHMKAITPNKLAYNNGLQDRLIEICQKISGITLPE